LYLFSHVLLNAKLPAASGRGHAGGWLEVWDRAGVTHAGAPFEHRGPLYTSVADDRRTHAGDVGRYATAVRIVIRKPGSPRAAAGPPTLALIGGVTPETTRLMSGH
jgi:hypothetical protein